MAAVCAWRFLHRAGGGGALQQGQPGSADGTGATPAGHCQQLQSRISCWGRAAVSALAHLQQGT
jgi:hypothetical protein